MFCGFGRAPRIMRLFCRGQVIERDDARFEPLVEHMQTAGMIVERPEADATNSDVDKAQIGSDSLAGVRAVILLDVWKVQTSCGFGVPLMNSVTASEKDVEPQTHPATGVNLISDVQSFDNTAKPWEDRDTMSKWATTMVRKSALECYKIKNNGNSLDGLPGLKVARKSRGEWLWLGDVVARTRRVSSEWEAIILGILIAFTSFFTLKQLGISI
jgi:hypothetical protein